MSFNFFANKECEFYPCHKDVEVNCLFCFCPLYNSKCEGNFVILENGIKDCSNCILPHNKNGYDYIIEYLKNECKKDK